MIITILVSRFNQTKSPGDALPIDEIENQLRRKVKILSPRYLNGNLLVISICRKIINDQKLLWKAYDLHVFFSDEWSTSKCDEGFKTFWL